MWQMKEFLFKFVVHAVWRRRKELYYAVSVVSIAGNLVVWVGPSVRQSSIVLRRAVLQAAWSALPQVAELVLHRSVLYLLLNLIVVRIVVKSGMLGRTSTPVMPGKVDDFCLPASRYYVVRSLPWPATFNSYGVSETQAQASMPCLPTFTDTSMWLQQAQGEDQNNTTVDVCAKTPARMLRAPTIKKLSWVDDKQPKCAPAPSLFTIEPLDDLVQTTESYTSKDDQAHADNTLKHPLRKVASRRADLHCSYTQACIGKTKGSQACIGKTKDPAKRAVEPPQQKNEQAMQLVLAKQDGDGEAAAEHEDNRLSGQEFNERVDTFISKFKRSLTMQRQDSFNRLLGLVGGGGDIRLIK